MTTKEKKELDMKERTIERKAVAEKQIAELQESQSKEQAALAAFVKDANADIERMQQSIGQRGAAIFGLKASIDTMASLLEE